MDRKLIFDVEQCDLCGACVALCPQVALFLTGKQLHIDNEKCNQCGICQQYCPCEALYIDGERQVDSGQ